MFNSEEFDNKTALMAAVALRKILARRTHKKVILGEERLVAGTLGEVVRLPVIIGRLENRASRQKERGLQEFRALWDTLSLATTRSALNMIGWYDPDELDWDDKRSNRRPDVSGDQ